MYKIKRNCMRHFFMFLLLSSFVVVRAAAQSLGGEGGCNEAHQTVVGGNAKS
jgi:hypothetical protein